MPKAFQKASIAGKRQIKKDIDLSAIFLVSRQKILKTIRDSSRKRIQPSLQKHYPLPFNPEESMKSAVSRSHRWKRPFSDNHTLARIGENAIDEVKDVSDAIEDHSSRRIQILYYILAAYHNEKCVVYQGHTNDQYGYSTDIRFSSAHSSVLANLDDNFVHTLMTTILQEGFTKKAQRKLKALGVPDEVLSEVKKHFVLECDIHSLALSLFPDGIPTLISTNTHFYRVMNSTVELPNAVNKYDDVIESFFREYAVDLINQTAQGKLKPFEALGIFVEELKDFFQKSEYAAQAELEHLQRIFQLETQIHALEHGLREGGREEKEWLKEFLEALSQLGNCYKEMETSRVVTGLPPIKGRVLPYENIIQVIEKQTRNGSIIRVLKNKIDSDKMVAEMRVEILKMPVWAARPIEDDVENLRNLLEIIRHQNSGCQLPRYEYLSGKKTEEGDCVGMDVDELFEQKLQLITRE